MHALPCSCWPTPAHPPATPLPPEHACAAAPTTLPAKFTNLGSLFGRFATLRMLQPNSRQFLLCLPAAVVRRLRASFAPCFSYCTSRLSPMSLPDRTASLGAASGILRQCLLFWFTQTMACALHSFLRLCDTVVHPTGPQRFQICQMPFSDTL